MVDPAKIARHLTRALKRDSAQLVYRVLAPNHFTVRLPEAFMDGWQYLLPQLEQEMTEHVSAQVRKLELELLPGDMKVEFSADPGLSKGRIRVQSAFHRPGPQPARLLALNGRDQGRNFAVLGPVTVIGRGSVDVDLDPEEGAISRRHAQIVGPNGGFMIQDLNSLSGTFVNARPITQDRLHSGDEINVGGVILGFETNRTGEVNHG